MAHEVKTRYRTFHESCPEAIQIEIADRVARSLNPDGDPAGDRLLEQMMLQLDADTMEIYDRPALDAFIKRWSGEQQ
jgi:hypothetical protein